MDWRPVLHKLLCNSDIAFCTMRGTCLLDMRRSWNRKFESDLKVDKICGGQEVSLKFGKELIFLCARVLINFCWTPQTMKKQDYDSKSEKKQEHIIFIKILFFSRPSVIIISYFDFQHFILSLYFTRPTQSTQPSPSPSSVCQKEIFLKYAKNIFGFIVWKYVKLILFKNPEK